MSDPRNSSNNGSTVPNPGVIMNVKEANPKYLLSAERQIPKGYKQTEVGVIPGDWNIACLKTLVNPKRPISYGIVQTGPNIPNGIRCLRVLDISNGKINNTDLITTTDEISESYKRTVLKFGDLVMPLRGNVGDVGHIDNELVGCNLTRGLALIAIRSEWSASFCRQFISSSQTRARLEQAMNGSALQEIPIASLRTFKIALPPSKAEQEAIAEALSDADALINALEQLIAKKRQLKQGTMQELLTGKRRLPGFSGEWKEKRIGDALTIQHGKSQHAVTDQNGIYPILATGGQIGTANRFLYDKPSVLIGRKGTIDQPQYMEQPFWTVDTLFYSVINQGNNTKFLFYRFCLIDWKQHNEASGVPSLNARTIERIEIKVPLLEEQTAIAQILTDMDAEITELETKLTKARAVKQGMMQQLLTGKIRLV